MHKNCVLSATPSSWAIFSAISLCTGLMVIPVTVACEFDKTPVLTDHTMHNMSTCQRRGRKDAIYIYIIRYTAWPGRSKCLQLHSLHGNKTTFLSPIWIRFDWERRNGALPTSSTRSGAGGRGKCALLASSCMSCICAWFLFSSPVTQNPWWMCL